MHALSPADELATRTISTLTFGVVQPEISRPVLALWECVIGLGLITGIVMRGTLFLLFVDSIIIYNNLHKNGSIVGVLTKTSYSSS